MDERDSGRRHLRHEQREWVGPDAKRIALAYLVLTLLVGGLLILFDQRPATNDLEQHWQRASLISQGQFVAQESPKGDGKFGGYIDGEFVAFNNTAVNSPVAYFPSWFCLGRYRLACMLTLLIATLATALGVYLAGSFATLLCAAALLPMVFFSFTYPTADAMSNSMSILFIGSVLHFYQKERYVPWQLALLIGLGFVLGQVKVTCIILLLLLLLPFHKRFLRDGVLDWWLSLPAVAGVVSAYIWSRFTTGIAPVYQPLEKFRGALPAIVTDPVGLLRTVFITTFNPLDLTSSPNNGGRNSFLFFGSEFVQLPALIMAPILIAIVLMLARGNGANRAFDKIDRAIIVTTALLFFLGTHVAMLASWSASMLGTYNQGIQTRYFIPEVPLVGLMVPYLGVTFERERVSRALIVGLLVWGYGGLLIAHLMPL